MSTELRPTIEKTNHDGVMNHVDDLLIGQIWHDLDGQVTREQIRQVVSEIADEFSEATVTAFVPIFIRRQARAKLEAVIHENRLSAANSEITDHEQ